MKIVIDPGHGGKDPGATNKYFQEKDMVLQISKYQYNRFKQLGIDVVLTRDRDFTLEPNERIRKVKESGANICISNHINSAESTRAEGAEIIHSIYNDGKLANLIMNELVNVGAKKRRVFSKSSTKDAKKDYYYMQRETGSVTTLILEYGFLTNSSDTKKILENWERYAEAVIKGVCKYLGTNYVPPEGNELPKPINGVHWAERHFNNLISKGIKIEEKRYDDTITRGEMLSLLDRLTDWINSKK
ncbi:N-acetylmuramoyl-L-alanine amidase [Gottschalkia purinilytica]|uniref:N-acetylmuramoyl-L-alanine amidase n=1 Tax=Gottschalkia purinilytica TaxID=1503 RepID=A0A0L0WFH4_GOTPU|nr:N-acetylmuramoyl-L-alanine amidase [Gottschalkia purinilytica]KNF10181.1 N-acetylmuramoyl-L-alanine amidase [Gottschalkia purinilytica]